jgi:hypothetical protein
MNTRRTVVSALVVAGCLVSGLLVRADDGGRKTYQTVNMIKAGVGTKLQSGATLYRGRHSLEGRVAASHLDPNAAYTTWWVIFNNPAACGGPCSPAKLGIPAVRASVFYAAGFVTGDDGTANITAHADDGTPPAGVEVTPDGTVAGLDIGNGFGAEVWLVVRSHGAIIAGMTDKQIGSFNGACPPNVCMNQQVGMFQPVAPPKQDEDHD